MQIFWQTAAVALAVTLLCGKLLQVEAIQGKEGTQDMLDEALSLALDVEAGKKLTFGKKTPEGK